MNAELPAWVTILLTLAGGLMGGGSAYGMLVTRMNHLERRVDEKASKEAHDALREYLDTRFSSLEQLIRDAR